MPLSKAHKEDTRRKIIEAAAGLFRAKGYHGIGIAGIMSEVGLTRGGFYAHFWSKAALFREVLRSEPEITHKLGESELGESVKDALEKYLDHNLLEQNFKTCNLAALAGDVAKSDAITRQAYTSVFKKFVTEIENSPVSERVANTPAHQHKQQEAHHQDALLLAVLAIGGLTIASALNDSHLSEQILEVCKFELARGPIPDKNPTTYTD